MTDFIRGYRARILDYLSGYLGRHPDRQDRSLAWGRDALGRIESFTSKGKLIRGSLALYVAESLGYRDVENALRLASALELMQTGLLVHDDIMDRDRFRRGLPTVFFQYAQSAALRSPEDAYHYGESMGICAGDAAFYLAFELLASLDVQPDRYRNILRSFGLEYSRVALAQMADVHNGSLRGEPVSRKEVLAVYKYKTARYTFSMPMALGAILAGADASLIAVLEDFGESLGVLFQLKDDELGMFGDAAKLGKPTGSDVREGKKTLLFAMILEDFPVEQRARLLSIYGNPKATEQEIRALTEWTKQSGVYKKYVTAMRKWARKAENRLDDLSRWPRMAEDLRGWIEYNLERNY